jgi:hypothetical protein
MEPGKYQSIETSLRQLRIVHAAMLVSIVLYAFISSHAPARPAPASVVLYLIAGICVAEFGVILVLRNKLLGSAGPISSSAPDEKIVVARWRTACIVTWAMCEAIGLFGLVLRYLGFPMAQAMCFFVAGFALLLLFAPKRPGQLSRFSD